MSINPLLTSYRLTCQTGAIELEFAAVTDSSEKPGQSTIEAAILGGDTTLSRKIAAERKGLTEQQRQALLLVADLLDYAAKRRADHA